MQRREIPLHICPIVYDLWCGAIVATVTSDDETMQITRVRSADDHDDTEALELDGLHLAVERGQVGWPRRGVRRAGRILRP